MPALVLTASFPLGQFQAHDEQGRPEWPPSPARVLAALLATAYARGRGVEEVRALYDLAPPTMHVPEAGRRDVDWRRWVPVNPGVKGEGPRMTLERQGKLEHQADRGMMVDPSAEVRWIFTLGGEELFESAADVLREVAREVPYLGRPTSPVMLDAVVMDDADVAAVSLPFEVWEPHENGAHPMAIGTPARLAALDVREAERAGRPTGHHPKMVERPVARYHVLAAVGDPQPMSRREFADLLEQTSFYSAPASRVSEALRAADASTVVEQLLSALGPVSAGATPWAVPVVTEAGAAAVPVLRGVLVHGCLVTARVPVAVPQGVATLSFSDAAVSSAARTALKAVVGDGETWTTLLPVRGGPDLAECVRRASAAAGAEPVAAETEAVGTQRSSSDPDSRCHVSVRFDRAVAGPVVLDGVAMLPVREGSSSPEVESSNRRSRYPRRRDLSR